jgi:hypothetical protein
MKADKEKKNSSCFFKVCVLKKRHEKHLATEFCMHPSNKVDGVLRGTGTMIEQEQMPSPPKFSPIFSFVSCSSQVGK